MIGRARPSQISGEEQDAGRPAIVVADQSSGDQDRAASNDADAVAAEADLPGLDDPLQPWGAADTLGRRTGQHRAERQPGRDVVEGDICVLYQRSAIDDLGIALQDFAALRSSDHSCTLNSRPIGQHRQRLADAAEYAFVAVGERSRSSIQVALRLRLRIANVLDGEHGRKDRWRRECQQRNREDPSANTSSCERKHHTPLKLPDPASMRI